VTEPPRLLAARSEHGYTSRIAEALPVEPEAVSAQTQTFLTSTARQHATRTRRHAWLEQRRRLEADLAELAGTFGPLITDELRGLRRGIDRLHSKLAQ
jgi:hypothetical protein